MTMEEIKKLIREYNRLFSLLKTKIGLETCWEGNGSSYYIIVDGWVKTIGFAKNGLNENIQELKRLCNKYNISI